MINFKLFQTTKESHYNPNGHKPRNFVTAQELLPKESGDERVRHVEIWKEVYLALLCDYAHQDSHEHVSGNSRPRVFPAGAKAYFRFWVTIQSGFHRCKHRHSKNNTHHPDNWQSSSVTLRFERPTSCQVLLLLWGNDWDARTLYTAEGLHRRRHRWISLDDAHTRQLRPSLQQLQMVSPSECAIFGYLLDWKLLGLH